MHQHLLAGQTHHADRKCNACEQIQSLRDHTDNRSDRRSHALPDRRLIDKVLLAEQNNTDRDNNDTHDLDKTVKRPDHFRYFTVLHLFCFQRQFCNIGIASDLVNPCTALAGYDKASGKKLVSFFLRDLIRFTGQQCLVYKNLTLQHDRIGGNLISG